jgi:hypothetical protein
MLQGWQGLSQGPLPANDASVEFQEASQTAQRAHLRIEFQALLDEPGIQLKLLPVLGILGTKATPTTWALTQRKQMHCGLPVSRMCRSKEEAL